MIKQITLCYKITCPQRLYMYFKAEGAEKFLENHNLKLSDPRKCNDPFECTIDYNASLKTTGFKDLYPNYEPLNERDILDLRTKWLETHKHLRISCFTEEATNILMWAYYAEQQKGICIEFDPSKDPLFFKNLREVRYETKLATIGKGIRDDELDYSEVLTTKAKRWQHEKEWRVIRDDLYGDFFPISPQAITSVIFGCASASYYNDYGMSGTYERIFQLLQRPEYAHIQLQCISQETDTFKLQCRNMPFFVFMKDQHTISIISTRQQCLQIRGYNDNRDIIYEASVCQWEKNTITLPHGYYLISNAVDDDTIRLQVFDE